MHAFAVTFRHHGIDRYPDLSIQAFIEHCPEIALIQDMLGDVETKKGCNLVGMAASTVDHMGRFNSVIACQFDAPMSGTVPDSADLFHESVLYE